MRNWNNADGTPNNSDRLDGMKAFEAKMKLPENSGEAGNCKGHPDYTKKLFALWAEFYRADQDPPPPPGVSAIPADTVFRFWESGDTQPDYPDRAERDKEVVLVVDVKNVGLEPLGDAHVWRCTYTPYKGIFVAGEANPS